MFGLAAHTARNLKPLLEALRLELQGSASVLEIGSGNGQHATSIAAELRYLDWQTSERPCNITAIKSWLDTRPIPNVKRPIELDVLEDMPPVSQYDAVFSANTAHIMGEAAVAKMFEVAGLALRANGRFCLYGPFRQDGQFNSPSNADFDRQLRARDPSMGIRDLELLDEFGLARQLRQNGVYSMPANNLLVTWVKQTEKA